MLLALDSSTRYAGIALYDEERGVIAETNWFAGVQHTVALMPHVEQMLSGAGATPADLSAVTVALGPGSFTGVRVALAAAKGLVLAHRMPLLGVSTLDATAYAHREQPLPVMAVVQAGRGRVCWARYRRGAAGQGAETPHVLSDVADLAAAVTGPSLFCGELTAADRAALRAQLGERATILSPALALRRAGCLAEIGWQRLIAGARDDVAALSPLYMQQPAGIADQTGRS